jgi:glycine/D-amino acid oxidase-like deaminating enzyme/nitrite reductase/ring-hydroxylating ferredoxin subunit
MNVENERSRSVWMNAQRARAQQLDSDLRTEILVIGSGITGLSTAYELMLRGYEVAVADRGAIAGGMTARTSAHLSWQIDDLYAEVIRAHGKPVARRYLESQKAAVDRIEAICADAKIECGFKRLDLYVFAPDTKGRRRLEKEIDAAGKVGFAGVEWSKAPLDGPAEACLRFPNQARFHPLQYLSGLAKALKRRGARLHANTPVVSVDETARGVVAKTENGHTITARAVVAATNSPFVNRLAVHQKQAPYRTYVMTGSIPKGSAADALIWDTEDPYHYVRIDPREKDDLLIFGGEDHKSASSDDAVERLKRLEAWARQRFPKLRAIEDTWSGLIYEPFDDLPFIGKSPQRSRVFIVTGDSGEGLTTGVAASLILPDLIEGKKNRWASVYNPNRKVAKPSPVGDYVRQAAETAKSLVEKITGGAKPQDVPRGQGAIIKLKGEKHAAYRDQRGELHLMKAACTHAGCTVQWNSFEDCWDCPCHGSQFAATGEPLQCPAISPLEAVDVDMAETVPVRKRERREKPRTRA